MKIYMYIAFVFCFVVVLGQEEEVSEHDKRINEMLEIAAKACAHELKIGLVDEEGYPKISNLDEEACLKACIDKKIGVVNEDGTYNIERILSLADTPELRKLAEELYNKKIKECTPIVDKGACKMAACVHGMPDCTYMDGLHHCKFLLFGTNNFF